MTAFWSPLAVFFFLAVVGAAHILYFYVCFPTDGRLTVKLAPTPGAVRKIKASSAAIEALLKATRQEPASTLRRLGSGRGVWTVIGENPAILEGIIADEALLCDGNVKVRTGTVVAAKLKVRGSLEVGDRAIFLSDVIADGDVQIGKHCEFFANVVCRGRVFIGAGACFVAMSTDLLRPIKPEADAVTGDRRKMPQSV